MSNREIDSVPWSWIFVLTLCVCLTAAWDYYDTREDTWGDPNPIKELFNTEEPILTRTLMESDVMTFSKSYVKNY